MKRINPPIFSVLRDLARAKASFQQMTLVSLVAAQPRGGAASAEPLPNPPVTPKLLPTPTPKKDTP